MQRYTPQTVYYTFTLQKKEKVTNESRTSHFSICLVLLAFRSGGYQKGLHDHSDSGITQSNHRTNSIVQKHVINIACI